MKIIVILLILMGLHPYSTKEAIIEQQHPIYLQALIVVPVDYDSLILVTLWKNNVSIDLSYIILAQAKHETWGFTSDIFIENNNFFGIKEAKKRKRTCIGTNRGHAVYSSLEDCVLDYIYYMENRNIPFHETSIRKYTNLLKKKGYFEDDVDRYYKGVKKYYKEINS